MKSTTSGRRALALLPVILVLAPGRTALAQSDSGILNRLNPEISATADVLLLGVPAADEHDEHDEHAAEAPADDHGHAHAALFGEDDSGFRFVLREVEVDFRASIDPFAAFRTTLGFSPEGVELEEAWFEWVGVLPHLNLKAGRFRQSLGPVNRWHLHAWDQVELPLAMRTFLGGEGLAQTGLSLGLLFGGIGDSALDIGHHRERRHPWR